jgi:L-aminopeptidase/D-esterase-like protein
MAGVRPGPPLRAENTSIGVVATNVALTKAEATKVAQMAHDGLARSIRPVHTPWDGDTLFALSTGTVTIEQASLVAGALAAEAVARAVLRAVTAAVGLPGYPSASDLAR